MIAGLRIWLRYIVPLTVLSAIALAPAIAIAWRTRAAVSQAQAGTQIAVGWIIVGMAWLAQLVLVGGAAAMVERPGQLRAVTRGAARMVGAIAPCLAAAAAVVIGWLALVVPGLILLALLSLVAASPARGVVARLRDSIAVARRRLPVVAMVMGGMIVVDVAIGIVAHRLWVAPLPRKPSALQLGEVRHFVQAIAIALVVVSPLPAAMLAAVRGSEPAIED